MLSDIEIARRTKLKSIGEVAASIGITDLIPFGKYAAKITTTGKKRGKLVLVSAISPTKFGEGKTTVSIGLADGLRKIGKNACLALREPSLGPVFGIKGGAAGGGYSQIAPMEDINLHFNGDMHAITAANNLLCAMIDNHIHFNREPKIKTVLFRRCLDVNDRVLRNTVVGLGGALNGTTREDGFDITAASEIMAVLCLSKSRADLKARLSRIIAGIGFDGKYITAGDINAQNAMAILLKDAIFPNLVQTLEGVPAFVHGGPFANIAHGCNSIKATSTALSFADIVVTEAGFGADLGAQKFFDIKCKAAGVCPSAVVLVATIRALKANGGGDDGAALESGLANLTRHVENIKNVYKMPIVVAINKFSVDSDAELELVRSHCASIGASCEIMTSFLNGGAGAEALARAVLDCVEKNPNPTLTNAYEQSDSIQSKLESIAKRIYRADGVVLLDKAKKSLAAIENAGFGNLDVCVAKTQYSFSDNMQLVGAPKDFVITVRDFQLRAGAGFVVAVCGDMMLMPGLSEIPNAVCMTISDDETDPVISGLF